jgi:hypothetical protein
VTCTDILITEREGAEGGPTPIPTARGDPLCTCPIGEFTNKEGSYKPQVTTCFPCRSGCRPATLSLVLGWPGVLLVICLSLRIHRATAAVAKLPKPPQQRRQPGNHSKRISDKKLQLKTRLTWLSPPLSFSICTWLESPHSVPPIGQVLRSWVTLEKCHNDKWYASDLGERT